MGLATSEHPILRGIVDAPFRDIYRPSLSLPGRASGRDALTFSSSMFRSTSSATPVLQLLHDPSALRLEVRLLCERVVLVTSVPWQLKSSRRSEQAE